MAVLRWRVHQIFMLALAGLRWPKERWLRMLFVPQLPLAWQSQGRESMLIDVHPSKFRKNQKTKFDGC